MVDAEVPDLLISDFAMPGMDGIAFVHEVLARHSHVRVVLHTGSVLKTIPTNIILAPKPCEPAMLRALVVQLLRGESVQDDGPELRTG
jgi:CheY-like chemotaxis protein